MDKASSLPDTPFATEAFMGFVGFVKWASNFAHEITERKLPIERGLNHNGYSVFLELSAGLSASINFGYDPTDQTIFLAVEPEEFAWLPLLPIEEVVVGREQVYVLTREIVLDGEHFKPIAIAVHTNQPKLWRAFPGADSVGFMCLHFSDAGYEVSEFAGQRSPLRYLND